MHELFRLAAVQADTLVVRFSSYRDIPPLVHLTPDEAKVFAVFYLGFLLCLVALPILAFCLDWERKDTFIRVEETTLTICRTTFWDWLRGRWICTLYGTPVEIRMRKSVIKNYVKAGMGPKCGDSICVLLLNVQEYDDDMGAYVNKSFKVLELRGIIPAPEQPTPPGGVGTAGFLAARGDYRQDGRR